MPQTILTDHVRRFARYNRWANRRVYEACAQLSSEDYHAPRPSFFGSIHATLNHLLVGDSIWFGRFTGNVPTHMTRLDMILHETLAELRAARQAKDEEIIAFADSLDAAKLSDTFSYANMAGQRFTDPLFPPLMHVFNHQTHHRGQVHGLLSHAGASPPSLDMIYFMREPA
ncbi:damage-inducible protein DinB [Ferrovibrio terrae]|uniref:Damage-inducible protein DinB n=1 Tax=Ferrovibrio terrae TaxID=2594003 RepID=A0A516GYV0_9PROT|nr:DinB family protein [Ferrovibrio terrae]QDO96696.1 damage-inducible protein DinB [Ferrovibrio terrae]